MKKDIELKYIDLLLHRCLSFENTKSLFVSYYKYNKKFIEHLVEVAKKDGIEDIYLEEEDPNELHDKLKNMSLEEIEESGYFDKSIWDEYAKKNACFLMLKGEYPGLMKDIDSKKIAKMNDIAIKTKPLYRKKQMAYEIPWCIAVLPNKIWAEDMFPQSGNAEEELTNLISEVCLLNEKDPIKAWDKKIEENKKFVGKLNSMKIKKLRYKNKLGTNLSVSLIKENVWVGTGTDGTNLIVNMPSYEIFTSPDYRKTEGIVYNSRPLIYSGKEIDDFFIEFKAGKVVNFDAKNGKEVLEDMINGEEQMSYLGEAALVNFDSPISNTKQVFKTTLLDENASCHLALGSGFPECISCRTSDEKDLMKKGINSAGNHVDFMIGTEDLSIIAETYDGKTVEIFKNGNFVI